MFKQKNVTPGDFLPPATAVLYIQSRDVEEAYLASNLVAAGERVKARAELGGDYVQKAASTNVKTITEDGSENSWVVDIIQTKSKTNGKNATRADMVFKNGDDYWALSTSFNNTDKDCTAYGVITDSSDPQKLNKMVRVEHLTAKKGLDGAFKVTADYCVVNQYYTTGC